MKNILNKPITDICCWKDFSQNGMCKLFQNIDNNTGHMIEYFGTIINVYHGPKNEIKTWITYEYSGAPCGDSIKVYCDDKNAITDIDNHSYYPIKDLYKDAEMYGFGKEHIDALINQEEIYWKYDENGNLIDKAFGWKWNFYKG